jgi:hypothetical protein
LKHIRLVLILGIFCGICLASVLFAQSGGRTYVDIAGTGVSVFVPAQSTGLKILAKKIKYPAPSPPGKRLINSVIDLKLIAPEKVDAIVIMPVPLETGSMYVRSFDPKKKRWTAQGTSIVEQADGYIKFRTQEYSVFGIFIDAPPLKDMASMEAALAKSVQDLRDREIMDGFPDGYFRQNAEVSRAEFASILVRAADLPRGTSAAVISDVRNNDWAKDDIETVVMSDYLKVGGNMEFLPKQPISRDEAAQAFMKAFPKASALLQDQLIMLAPEDSRYLTRGELAMLIDAIITAGVK